jgi:hypothetical protein
MRTLSKFWQLSLREKRLLLEAATFLVLSNLAVKMVAFRYNERLLHAFCTRFARRRSPNACYTTADISLLNRSISRAANRFPWKSLCLSRSMTAFIMFSRRGIPSVMILGAKCFGDTSLCAHAWVDADHENYHEDSKETSEDGAAFTPLFKISYRGSAGLSGQLAS